MRILRQKLSNAKNCCNKIKIDFVNMYDWKFDQTTGGIFTGRHDRFGVEIYEGNRVETPLGIGIVRYNPKYWRFEIAEENEPLNNIRENAGIPEECWVVL